MMRRDRVIVNEMEFRMLRARRGLSPRSLHVTMQRFSADEISIMQHEYEPDRSRRIAVGDGMAPATIGTAAMPYDNCSASADRVTAVTIA
jgi:hypothetical protein